MASTANQASRRDPVIVRGLKAWNEFWFRPGDPTTLGLIRLFCGLVVFYIHLAYSYDLQAFFGKEAWIDLKIMKEFLAEAPTYGPPTDWTEPVGKSIETDEQRAYQAKWGGHPDQAVAKGKDMFSIWFHVTDPFWMRVVHVSVLLIMFMFAIGFCTRVTSVLTWLALLSYIQRAPTSLFGVDTITNIITLYCMIGPSGAAFSVDRLIYRYWVTERALRRGQPIPDLSRPEPSVSANLALRLIQVHFCIIYLVAGLSKLQGGVWWGGTAVWGTMANPEFSPVGVKIYLETLRFLSRHRWMWETVMMAGSYGTLIFEITFPFLVWSRTLRWTMIVCAVLLHLGIALCMGLVTFSLMMLIGVLSFVPAEAIRELLARLGRGPTGVRLALAQG